MTRPAVTFPRVVAVVIDFLTAAIMVLADDDGVILTDDDGASLTDALSVGYGLPTSWTRKSDPHIQVGLDGTFVGLHPVAQTATIRLVGWSQSPTLSEHLVQLASGLMYNHVGPEFSARPLTGPLPVTDPDHANAALCAMTFSVRVRSVPIV